jgi:methylthioribose-1-phosphate isomerase
MDNIRVIEWKGDYLEVLDQSKLPEKEEYIKLYTVESVARVIEEMKIRGAPLIGITAAYGLVLGYKSLTQAAERLKSTRPTAVNLQWAVDRMLNKASETLSSNDKDNLRRILLEEAKKIHEEEKLRCEKLSEIGLSLINDNTTILTLCNAGALATGGLGTALGIIYKANQARKGIKVYACETRPKLQGAKLTVYELTKSKVDVTLICDSTAAYLMQQKKINVVIVGADRIAKNGDVANKIGTYNLAVLAYHHHIPIYVAAPTSTIDTSISNGNSIPIENRSWDEVKKINQSFITLKEAKVYNPAFDVTPAAYITAIITETGIYKYPYNFC